MSRHRIKDVGYDDDDYYSDDGYASPDPEEQELLQQCTAAVLAELSAGQPSVAATKEEVQEALWHYYNDIEKSVTYLRGMFTCASMRLVSKVFEEFACWDVANPMLIGKKEKEAVKQKPKATGKQDPCEVSLLKCSGLARSTPTNRELQHLVKKGVF
jgi:elongation factor 1 alpha-like protein